MRRMASIEKMEPECGGLAEKEIATEGLDIGCLYEQLACPRLHSAVKVCWYLPKPSICTSFSCMPGMVLPSQRIHMRRSFTKAV